MVVIFATGMMTRETEWVPSPAAPVKRVVTAHKTLWWNEARTVSLLEHWTGLPVLHPSGECLGNESGGFGSTATGGPETIWMAASTGVDNSGLVVLMVLRPVVAVLWGPSVTSIVFFKVP